MLPRRGTRPDVTSTRIIYDQLIAPGGRHPCGWLNLASFIPGGGRDRGVLVPGATVVVLKVDIRLPGKGNSHSHGARPVY